MTFQSTKRFTGFTTCFRQYKATHSHCQYLHGYSLEFIATFEGQLDQYNWVNDFGIFSKNGVKQKLKYLFDHTTLVDQNDPLIDTFQKLHEQNIIQMRIIENLSSEYFAKIVFDILSQHNTKLMKCIKVQCIENNNNSASYGIHHETSK
tara:strand:- start:2879 stop:3325 length:447 start_codon:yes stop_codon:yes gene_type:complete